MKIILTLDHSIDEYEAKQIAESLESEPWCKSVEIIQEHCGKCAPFGDYQNTKRELLHLKTIG